MRLAQLGIPAVSLMGVHVSDFQLALLKQARAIFVLLDGDAAGISGAFDLSQKLRGHPAVRMIHLPKGKDPDDLSDQDLYHCLATFFSFN
jgi:DNA primase